ncbi:MAG: MocR-like pyridoxine biosynthesis transcription factor PdxR [Christensenellales bacterium]
MLFLSLQRESKKSFAKQIYGQIKDMILNCNLAPGDKLPSTRELAQQLNIARNTVITAYEMLISEGYVDSVPGVGIYIAQGKKTVKPPEIVHDFRITAFSSSRIGEDIIHFHSGIPSLEYFPRNKWAKTASAVLKEAPISAFGYGFPQGQAEFRNTLAVYLKKTRDITCTPEQIMVTSGTEQSISIVAQTLLDEESVIWIEDPQTDNTIKMFSYYTMNMIPLPMDNHGIKTDMLPVDITPDLIFTTPSHQYPTGCTLSMERRRELIQYAQQTDSVILEDDCDSEFWYNNFPEPSLHELDSDHVIYVGTFAKLLFPSLRLGYMVLPEDIYEQCMDYKRRADHHSNVLNQLTLMRFIESGELEHHALRMRKIYLRRRDALIEKLHTCFGDRVSYTGANAGTHIVARFEGVNFTPELIGKIQDAGVSVIPVERHALIKGTYADSIILGYGHLNEEDMSEGIARLKKALADVS